MRVFRDELDSAASSHEKLKARVRALRRFIFLHYVLLLLSLAQGALTLYAVISIDVPFRSWLLWLTLASLGLSFYSLFSGLGGNEKSRK